MPPLTLVLAACLGLCLAATACGEGYGTEVSGSQPRQDAARQDQATNNVTPTASATVPALTRDALRSAEYAAGFPTFGTLQRDRIGAQDPLAFGDLNGDGVDDAAVVLLLVDGNSGHFYLVAVLNKNSAPRHVASAFLGLNIGIDSVTIAEGVVTLQTKQLGPNDPNCCPAKEVVATFQLTGNTWQLLAETPPGQITNNLLAVAPTPTAIPAVLLKDHSCLTLAELDYLSAFQTAIFESTDESQAAWRRARYTAIRAYDAVPYFEAATSRQQQEILYLASQAVETLRLHGLAVYAGIENLSAPPTARTARLHTLAAQYYQIIESGYLYIMSIYNEQLPDWILATGVRTVLGIVGLELHDAMVGEPPADDVLGIWTYWAMVVAEPHCQ